MKILVGLKVKINGSFLEGEFGVDLKNRRW
jgi:hypothetical protein